MILLLACARSTDVAATVVLADWTTTRSATAIVATHAIDVPPELAGASSRFLVDRSTWRATLQVDGVAVAEGTGGPTPLEVAVPGGLPAGAHTLTLTLDGLRPDTVLPGRTVRFPSAWAFARSSDPVFGGRVVWEVGRAADWTVQGVVEDGRLHARVLGAGLDGIGVRFAVRTDAGVTDVGSVRGGAELDVPWTGPGWPSALPLLVATTTSGATLTTRLAARDVDLDRALVIDGVARRRAGVRADWASVTDRDRMYAISRAAAARGAEALEWHADLYNEAALAVADELGIEVVAVPLCAGARQVGPPPDDEAGRSDFVRAALGRFIRRAEGHPALIAWTSEWDERGVPLASVGTAAVIGRGLAGTLLTPGQPTPPWVIEVTASGTGEATLAWARTAFAEARIGMVLPTLAAGTTVAPGADEADRNAVLAAGGVPWTPADRLGPATVVVSGRAGDVVAVDVAGLPSAHAVIGPKGTASIEVDASGPARIRTASGSVAIELRRGAWTAGRWDARAISAP